MKVKERVLEKEEYLFELCNAIIKITAYDNTYSRELVKVAEYYLKFKEYFLNDNYEDAITNGRRACEAICAHLYKSNGLSKGKETLNGSLNILFKEGIIDKRILDRFNSTRLWGNTGTHYQENELDEVTYDDAEWAFEGLKYIVKWYYDKFNINLEDIEWKQACTINTIESYENYITRKGDNKYKNEALKRIEELNFINQKENEEEINWNRACLENNNKLDNEEWRKALNEDSIESYTRYVSLDIINKRHYDEAVSKIKVLEENRIKEKEEYELYSKEELYRQARLLYLKAKNDDDYNRAYKNAWLSANKGYPAAQYF